MSFSIEKLRGNIWKVVQDDPFGQYPFLYVIKGADKVVLIDTGCPVQEGRMSYKEFIDAEVNNEGLRYVVVCTHVHFDHIGGNCEFCKGRSVPDEAFAGSIICMGGANKTFSQNYKLNSLAPAHNTEVADFVVDRWLGEGDVVHLDDIAKSREEALHVLFTPGHTFDSISLHYPGANRIFVGDLIYPFTNIYLDGLGSSVSQYRNSLTKLKSVCQVNGSVGLPAECTGFLDALGLTEEAVSRQFCVRTLLALCEGNVEQAVNMYLTSGDDVGAMCPPQEPGPPSVQDGDPILLSCGHVEASLDPSALSQVLMLLDNVDAGMLPPTTVDDGYGEFSDGTYSLMLPLAK